MAFDERADAVTTVDGDDADTPFSALSVAPQPDNGSDHASTSEEGDEAGNAEAAEAAETLASPFAPPKPASANGTGAVDRARPGRKRTSRQRSLLLAEAAAETASDTASAESAATQTGSALAEPEPAADVASPVDPLLAAAETDLASEPAADAEVALPEPRPETTHAAVDAEELTATPEPSSRASTKAHLPASTTATAVSAALAFAPSPSVTEALPLTAPVPLLDLQTGADATAIRTVTVVPPPPRPRRRARPRVRKVTRVVRSVDAWSVFKVAIVFFTAMGVVLLTAGVLLWNLAQTTGTLDNVEGFFREAFQYDTFKLQSEPVFKAGLTLIALFVVVGTGLSVVVAVLFNLIADLTGGIRLTVLEREVVARDDVRGRRVKRKRLRPVKRPPTAPATLPPDVPTPPPPG
jgi:hypothetical protein